MKLNHKQIKEIKTLGDLKKSGYQSEGIKEEIRRNLLDKLRLGEKVFKGVWGYDNSVIPDFERALLSRHDINLLGLRGQAKTRMARLMVDLLDDYIPIVSGSEINDDPLQPLSRMAKDLIQGLGDETPIEWVHKSERYIEKLATPDVTVADLIGDVDPIRAINEKLNYNDERVIHFGIIPRANRSIFVMNEMPDLQARIQVALFNILQEGDIQIRGFKFRLPLDMMFVFTANPEDYTNRGSIVTPLKDRIGSQILTHYPKSLEIAKKITQQEARLTPDQKEVVEVPEIMYDIIEHVVMEARSNEYVDSKSGVSVRLSITALENLVSAAERRAVINKERKTTVRISDLFGIIPSITGKIEMVYEGEQEGPQNVAMILIGKALREVFNQHFPGVKKSKKDAPGIYHRITEWFEAGNRLEMNFDSKDGVYARQLNQVDGLAELVDKYVKDSGKMDRYLWMELTIHGLAEHSKLSRKTFEEQAVFGDLLGSMLGNLDQKS